MPSTFCRQPCAETFYRHRVGACPSLAIALNEPSVPRHEPDDGPVPDEVLDYILTLVLQKPEGGQSRSGEIEAIPQPTKQNLVGLTKHPCGARELG